MRKGTYLAYIVTRLDDFLSLTDWLRSSLVSGDCTEVPRRLLY